MNKREVLETIKELQKEICKDCNENDYDYCKECKKHVLLNKIAEEINGE